jgi:prevent-host-death family protein
MEISATEFKAKCLKLMDEISKTHEPIIVTKHGRPVAKLVAVETEETAPKTGFGCMAGTIEIQGDIISPIEEPWSAIAGDEDEYYQDLMTRKEK